MATANALPEYEPVHLDPADWDHELALRGMDTEIRDRQKTQMLSQRLRQEYLGILTSPTMAPDADVAGELDALHLRVNRLEIEFQPRVTSGSRPRLYSRAAYAYLRILRLPTNFRMGLSIQSTLARRVKRLLDYLDTMPGPAFEPLYSLFGDDSIASHNQTSTRSIDHPSPSGQPETLDRAAPHGPTDLPIITSSGTTTLSTNRLVWTQASGGAGAFCANGSHPQATTMDPPALTSESPITSRRNATEGETYTRPRVTFNSTMNFGRTDTGLQ